MHLLIDARMYSPNFTGIGRYVYEITQELFRQKPDWKFTLFLGEQEYEKFVAPSANINAVLAPEKIYSAKEQTSFIKKLMSVKGDLTWFPHFNVPLLYPRKFVVTVHDLTLSKFPGKKHSFIKNLIYFAIIKNALWRSKKILTVSQNTKNDLINDESVQSDKIIIAGNAVGEEFLNFSPEKDFDLKALGITEKFFLYTGQWRSHKNILGMTQAFHQFLQRKRTENPHFKAQLVLTGKPNPLYPEVLEYREKHHLEKEIIPVGLVRESDLLHLYFLAEVFVFPSFYEGFGIPPLEAMAMKTPVVASNAACIPEVCSGGAIYFSPENTEEMSQKMESVFGDDHQDLRNKMIAKGLEQIKKYSWKDSTKKIIHTFESV